MTAFSPTTNKPLSLGDRFAELAVVALTVVALAFGWLLKSTVENRSLPFQSGDITVRVPAGWFAEKTGQNEVLRVSDRTTTGFGTTYAIQQQAVAADMDAAAFVSLLTLQRGTSLTAYRVLDQQDVLVGGRQAVQVEYVYVESAANLSNDVLPAVVHGLDYIFVKDGRAVIITYNADQSLFDANLGRFQRFLVSVQF